MLDVPLPVIVVLEVLQDVRLWLVFDESGQHLHALRERDLLSVPAERHRAVVVVGQLDVLQVLVRNVLHVDPFHDERALPLPVLHLDSNTANQKQ